MYAGGISYVSECSFGFNGRVPAGAAAIDAIERSKIERLLADIVENLIDVKWLRQLEWLSAHAIPDFRFIIPNRGAGALP
jgi:hypothetical protein